MPEDLRQLGTGFRDVRIYETTQKILNNEINLTEIAKKDTITARNELLTLSGVGPKVADCILLFSTLKRFDVFPIDVWVRRVMNELYIKNEDETTSACKEEPLTCTTVPKSISSLIKCSDYEVSTDKSATHYCVEETDTSKDTACKEIHICTEAESDEGDCSQFPVESSKSSTHVCVKAEAAEGGEGASHCEEKYLCNKVPSGTSVECQNLVISEENLNTHHCVSTTESDPEDVNAYACKEEKYTCAELPKIKDTETNIKCSDFSVDSDKATTHVCVEDTTSEDKQCKQMKLCSAVENNDMTADITCSSDFYYDKETYVCQKNEETNLGYRSRNYGGRCRYFCCLQQRRE